jgi:hypothetical protein
VLSRPSGRGPALRRHGGHSLKSAAHVHSEWSDDASWPLSGIAETFARRGYDVVLMCEHSRGFTDEKWTDYWQACDEASTDRLLLVPGIEYGDEDDVVHIPVWGRVPFLGEAPPIGDLLARATRLGGTAVWAHPGRRDAWRRFEPSWREYLGGIEVWNRKYDGVAANQGSLALARSHGTRQVAALDFHTRRQLFPLSLAITLPEPVAGIEDESAKLGVDDVYVALSAGSFCARGFGIPLDRLTSGPPALALSGLERARRAAARLLH